MNTAHHASFCRSGYGDTMDGERRNWKIHSLDKNLEDHCASVIGKEFPQCISMEFMGILGVIRGVKGKGFLHRIFIIPRI
jgi:hypothetical protein